MTEPGGRPPRDPLSVAFVLLAAVMSVSFVALVFALLLATIGR